MLPITQNVPTERKYCTSFASTHKLFRWTVSVKLSNTGEYDGDEVVQLYAKKIGENADLYANKALQGFKRVFLKKNESKTVLFALPVDQLRYYDEAAKTYKVAAGDYKLLTGSSSEDLRLKMKINVN